MWVSGTLVRVILVFCSLLLFFSIKEVKAQSPKQWWQAAEKSFEEKHFELAHHYYDVLLQFPEDLIQKKLGISKAYLLYHKGVSLKEVNDFSRAEEAFKALIEIQADSAYLLAWYYLAQAQQHQGHFEEAANSFETFVASMQVNYASHLIELAEKGIRNCVWAKQEIGEKSDKMDPQYLEIISNYLLDTDSIKAFRESYYGTDQRVFQDSCLSIYHLSDAINGPFAEFGMAKRQDTFLYTTFRELYPKQWRQPERTRYHVMYGLVPALGWEESAPITTREAGQTFAPLYIDSLHTSQVAFNEDGQRMYFSICSYLGTSMEVRCDLYQKTWLNGHWSKAEKLPINAPFATTEMPSIGYLDGKEWLFFSSDRPGGKGGLDIWMAPLLENGSFGDPKPLAALNTVGDDVSPFFHASSGQLFYSTDGAYTLGGLDVHASRWDRGTWMEGRNLGYPVNSTYDDDYFYLSPSGSTGFFASDRIGSILYEHNIAPCCRDIWRVDYDLSARLEVLTRNEKSKKPLQNCQLSWYEQEANGEWVLKLDTFLFNTDQLGLPIRYGSKYAFSAERNGFLVAKDTLDLSEVPMETCDKELSLPLYLTPQRLQVKVDVVDARDPNRKINNCQIEYNILGEDPSILDLLYNTFASSSTSNSFLFDSLKLGNRIRIVASHMPGEYGTDTLEFIPGDGDLIRLDKYTRQLNLTLQLSVNLDPIHLYFKNDRPGPRNRTDSIASVPYSRTFAEFQRDTAMEARRLQSILDRNGQLREPALRKAIKQAADPTIFLEIVRLLANEENFRQFFSNEVEGNFAALQKRMKTLKEILSIGDTVVISLTGYTSPLGNPEYNLVLSKRRISSIRQYIETYRLEGEGQVFLPYIQRNQLRFSPPVARGETEKEKDIRAFAENRTGNESVDPKILAVIDALRIISESRSDLAKVGYLPALARRIEVNFQVIPAESVTLSSVGSSQ